MHLALFDFDGSLTTCEPLPAFVRFAVPPVRLMVGQCVPAPMVFAYRRGWISGVRILPGVLLEQGMQRLQCHRARGDRVVVVSGGGDVYLQPWCESQGL
jgi:phosphatidylglycerophosphatase C